VRTNSSFVRLAAAVVLAATVAPSPSAQLLRPSWFDKLDPALQLRVGTLLGSSRVVIQSATPAALPQLDALVQLVGGTLGRSLPIVGGRVATLPNLALGTLAASGLVSHVSADRLVAGALERTGATIGSSNVREVYGYDGSGVTIATVDSGVTAWHDDLADAGGLTSRVERFVDFVGGATTAYDDYGHGTHVAGIIAGNGADSSGRRAGIAPGARLVALKVLDGAGRGRISDVIAALGYVLDHKDELGIRIVNLSVAASVSESYRTDPLAVATSRLVSAGVVVVAAAGNNGRARDGGTQYGGVAAPGNAPWVLTVGASSHMGTIDRADDTIAPFSSRGPSAVDANAKPDIVAPGVGIESLSDPDSVMYSALSPYLLPGTVATPPLPYLSLSGTSMATPVVSGTVALMLQANPSLTPNAVKAILEYTAQVYPAYDSLTEGAGFLNARGAVDVARALAMPGASYVVGDEWSTRIVWGNREYAGGSLTATAIEWMTSTTWGDTHWSEPGWTAGRNVVWGSTCGGLDCGVAWTVSAATNAIVPGAGAATVVWGTSDDSSTVVWGTSCGDPSCEPVIWNR
jgi:serine protease AprX